MTNLSIVCNDSKKSKDTLNILKDQVHDPLTIKENEALNEQMKTAGFFILLSRQELDKTQILPGYYARQAIERFCQIEQQHPALAGS